jgi:hypothetical protein
MRVRIRDMCSTSWILLLFIFTSVNISKAQFNPFRIFNEEKSLTYGLNNKISSFLDHPATQYGLHLGVEFGNKFKHTVTVNSTLFWVGRLAVNPNEVRQVRFTFFGFSEEYRLIQINQLSLNSYLHIGAGKAYFRSLSSEISLENSLASNFIFPLEFGLHPAYKLNNWSSVKLGVGYRVVLGTNETSLNGIYYKVGYGFDLNAFLAWTKEMRPIVNKLRTYDGFL